jgi:hypothetical protein
VAPHHDPFVEQLCDDQTTPARVRRIVLDAMHASAAAEAIDAAASVGLSQPPAVTGLFDGTAPWCLGNLLARASAGDEACTMRDVAQAAFVFAMLSSQPAGSPAAALPLAMTAQPRSEQVQASDGTEAAAKAHAVSLKLFDIIFDSNSMIQGSPARPLAIWVIEHVPWERMAAVDPVAMEHFVCAIALGLRVCGAHGCAHVQQGGVLLQLALEHCKDSEAPECTRLLELAAVIEQRAPAGYLGDPLATPGTLLVELQRHCTECAPPVFRRLAVAALAAWWLHGESTRGALVWMLAKKLTHNEPRVEAAAADALRAAATMAGTGVRELLLRCRHVMREAGLHAASHPQVLPLEALANCAPGCTYLHCS